METQTALMLLFFLAAGFGIGYYFRKQLAKSQKATLEGKLEQQLQEAKTKEKELLLSAKDKSLQIIEEAKKEAESQKRELKDMQHRIEKREQVFDQKLLDLQEKQQKIYEKAEKLDQVKQQIEKLKDSQTEKLQQLAGLTKDEAKELLLKRIEEEASESLASRLRKVEKENSLAVEKEANRVLANVIQRIAGTHVTENSTTRVDLPSDEMKGRIIGREGRNIKVIEQLTGTEILIDETPNVVTISGFSPVRRHIAKRALEKLILDGRIHPGRIEETIEESKKELAIEMKEAGEAALYELGITGFDPKLVQIIGRLKFRTSYGQNILNHSVEAAHIAALLARELGADVSVAKKGALLHDIGKAFDHDVTGTHTELGKAIGQKFNLPEEVVLPIIEHHEDKPSTIESVIVKVADAITAARPGARKDTYEMYVQRLEDLEKVATDFEGVDHVYAISAGREVRVFVKPENINDLGCYHLAKEIATKIESDLKYPGEIKVTVIRENRAIEYAR